MCVCVCVRVRVTCVCVCSLCGQSWPVRAYALRASCAWQLAAADLPYNGPNLGDDTVRTHCGLQRPGRRERESVVDVRHAVQVGQQ
jgi:hypothetical protein